MKSETGEKRLRVVEYLARDVSPRKRWWIRWRLISDPPMADLFFTVRAGILAFFVWCLLGGWVVSYSLGSLWYVESGWGHGLMVMHLDARYADRIGSEGWRISSNGRLDQPPQFIRSILASASAGHWPYAQWIEISWWLVAGVFGVMFVMVWRWTRLRHRIRKSLRERIFGAMQWALLIVVVLVIELVLLSVLANT